jgi:hypothetical protein
MLACHGGDGAIQVPTVGAWWMSFVAVARFCVVKCLGAGARAGRAGQVIRIG